MGQLMTKFTTGGGSSRKNLDNWNSYDLSQTISGLIVSVIAPAGPSSVEQETSNSRILVQYSNNGSNSGFLVKMPFTGSFAVHFAAGGEIFTSSVRFNNWMGLGFLPTDISATVASESAFDTGFGFVHQQAWAGGTRQLFKDGAWFVYDDMRCYILDNNYNVIVNFPVATAQTALWFSDQKSDTGGTNWVNYIDQVRYK